MQPFGTVIALAVVASLAISFAHSAPTETETSTTPMTPKEAEKQEESSTPSTSSQDSLAVSSAQDVSRLANTTFSCYNRQVGYYADIATGCRVYHFCLLGDYNGEQVYQRISYLCLNETKFDQQALDCTSDDKMTAPCADSEKHYEESNKILRQAIISQPSSSNETPASVSSTSTSTPEASSTTETAPSEPSSSPASAESSSEKANEVNASA